MSTALAAGTAAGFGGAGWGAAGLQTGVDPFLHLALPELHALLKLGLRSLDPQEQVLVLGRVQAVVFRGVGLQVEEQRGVVLFEEGSHVTVVVWGGVTVRCPWRYTK